MKELSVWADAVVFSILSPKERFAILACRPNKYFIVLSDTVDLWKRCWFFFAVKIAEIPLTELKEQLGPTNWKQI